MKFKSDIEVQAGLKDSSGSPGTANQLLSSTVTGTTWIDQSAIMAGNAAAVEIECKNTSGSTITKGTPVYQTGTVGAASAIEVAPADALYSANKNPAIGLLKTDLINNAFGFVVVTGELLNITTSPIDGLVPTTGDKVFLKSGGGLTLTKPTGEGNGIQNLGLVGKVAIGGAGSITVSSIMRTNDVPNLPTGRTWVGNSNTEVSQTIYIDEPNLRLGIGTTSPVSKLDIRGVLSFPYISTVTGTTVVKFSESTDDEFVLKANLTGFGATGNSMSFGSGISGWASDIMTWRGDGNVGIGTTSPTTKLQVYNSTEGQYMEVGAGDVGGRSLVFTSSNNNGSAGALHTINAKSINGAIALATAGSERVRITSDGNVGIGTTSPSEKLDVVGKIALNDGGNSVFIGTGAGLNDDGTSNNNVGVGHQALYYNTTGFHDTANGYQALYSNTTGSYNTANGYAALHLNTTGISNTANGAYALYYNTTGGGNTANGYQALRLNTTGASNTANGYQALFSNTTGNYNTANGYAALYSNTTGNYNTANGVQALHLNTTGNYNTANGYQALYSNTVGASNTANGLQALFSNTTGANNTANGYVAGTYLANKSTTATILNNSIMLGYRTSPLADNQTNQIVIGYDATGAGSNTATLGNTSITKTILRGNVETNGSSRVGDDVAAASAANVGAIRYRVSGNNSYAEMCMQTGAATYAWTTIVQHTW